MVSTGSSIDSPRSDKSCQTGQVALMDRVTGLVGQENMVDVVYAGFSVFGPVSEKMAR